jgi:hypothetical protein
MQKTYPSIHQWALDTLSFSSEKKLITPERVNLGDDIIEALECLKAWWDHGSVEQE